MAKKDTKFKPGQSGNPGGRPKLPEDIKKARRLNQVELERIVNEYLWMDRAKVQERIKDPATPMMEIMIASIVAQASQKGDQQRLDFILNRIIGKVTDKLEVKAPEPFVIRRPGGETVAIGAKEATEDSGE